MSGRTLLKFDEDAWPAFAEGVRASLAGLYPHFLPRFPEGIQTVIVGNMLARARRWGLREQGGLLSYCDCMVRFGGQVDMDPDVQQLIGNAPWRDELLREWEIVFPDTLQARLRANALRIGFFLAPGDDDKPLAERVRTALTLVLFECRPDQIDRIVETGARIAASRHLDQSADALLGVIAATGLYGENITDAPWADVVFGTTQGPQTRLEALRLRVALDFGRFI